jgi:2-amino-4-hydroxy-6-hydroxymethyldihydropteridine diphosphokinase
MNIDQAAVVAVGGNLPGNFPDSVTLFERALATFAAHGLPIVGRSSWWRSAAWPDPAQPDYRNAVILVEPAPPARELLQALLAIEAAFGRRRGEANAARTLDLDLIACGRQVSDEPGLTLPHPRAHQRLFVMGPLAEIAPHWVHPALGETAAALAARASVGTDARPLVAS